MTSEPPPIERKVLKFFGREQAYWTANGALLFFATAQMVWGLSPVLSPSGGTSIILAELGVAVTAGLAFVGIVLHTLNRRPWLARWCYLILSFSTGLTTVSFITAQIINPDRALTGLGVLAIFLLLTTGGLVTISMHIEHGGRRKVVRTKEA